MIEAVTNSLNALQAYVHCDDNAVYPGGVGSRHRNTVAAADGVSNVAVISELRKIREIIAGDRLTIDTLPLLTPERERQSPAFSPY